MNRHVLSRIKRKDELIAFDSFKPIDYKNTDGTKHYAKSSQPRMTEVRYEN